jgi:hypothetical protein
LEYAFDRAPEFCPQTVSSFGCTFSFILLAHLKFVLTTITCMNSRLMGSN